VGAVSDIRNCYVSELHIVHWRFTSSQVSKIRNPQSLELGSVVRGFFGYQHVVHVAFFQAEAGDANEPRAGLQLRDIAATAISHAGTQSTRELRDHDLYAPFIGNNAFDPLRHQFSRDELSFLRISV